MKWSSGLLGFWLAENYFLELGALQTQGVSNKSLEKSEAIRGLIAGNRVVCLQMSIKFFSGKNEFI